MKRGGGGEVIMDTLLWRFTTKVEGETINARIPNEVLRVYLEDYIKDSRTKNRKNNEILKG